MRNLNRRKIRQMILREMAILSEQASGFEGIDALQDMCKKNGIKCSRPSPQMLIISIAGQEIECTG